MTLTAGALSQVSVGATVDSLLSAAATSGSSPYSYQWYRAVSGTAFVPGGGNILSGQTALTLSDSGLTPGTIYYYKVIVTDTASATATASALAVTTTSAQPNPNQFAELAFLGMVDLKYSYNTLSVFFDPAGTGTLVGGQAVKWSTNGSGGTAPLIVPSTAQADVLAGFVNFNIKDQLYNPGDRLEISMAGNVIYLYATGAINRGVCVNSIPSAVAGGCIGGVAAVTGANLPIAGYMLDQAVSGQLARVFITINPAAFSIG